MAIVLLPEDIQMAFGIGLLKELAAFGRRRNRIEDSGVGDARLRVVRDKLISVCGNADAGIASSFSHESPSMLSFECPSI